MNIPSAISTTSQLINRDSQLESLGENLGEFKPYSNDLPITEIAGTRIVKCLYQTNKETGKRAGTNSYVRVPTKHLTEETIAARIADLTPYILSYLQVEEDKVIKAEHRKGGTKVYTEYLSLDKIIAILESTGESTRLNKDKIELWFSESMRDQLVILICTKLGVTAETITAEIEQKIELMIAAYKAKFISLASPKTVLVESDRLALVNVINKCEAGETLLGMRFISKIESMKDKVADALAEL